jgi:hypothetical protein
VTPLYQQKLALTSPVGGGRSVGIVRSRTKATEFSFISEKTRNLEVTVFAVKIITKALIYWENDVDILDVTQAVGSLQE